MQKNNGLNYFQKKFSSKFQPAYVAYVTYNHVRVIKMPKIFKNCTAIL